MARKKSIETDTLISLIDQFYVEKCNSNATRLKIPEIGQYVRSKGYDVADYVIRRDLKAREYIKHLQEATEEIHIHTVAVYRDMDIDAFLQKNNTEEKLKKALKERENYYREVTHSASYCFNEYKNIKQQLQVLRKHIVEMETALEDAKRDNSEIATTNKYLRKENKVLHDIIDTYVYPEIANELLKKQSVIKNTAEIISTDRLDEHMVSADTDVTKIRNNVIKGLFETL